MLDLIDQSSFDERWKWETWLAFTMEGLADYELKFIEMIFDQETENQYQWKYFKV